MPSKDSLTRHPVLLVCLAAVALSLPGHALAAAGKVTLELTPNVKAAPRGGVLTLEALLAIESGWHINAHQPTDPYLIPTKLSLTLPAGIGSEPIQYPAPVRKAFRFAEGKELLVYEGKLGLTTVLHVPAEFPGSRLRVLATLRYQACSDTVCLPPTTASAEALMAVTAEVVGWVRQEPLRPSGGGSPVEQWLDERGMVFTLLAVALLGIGLNLTPCVYPLITVTVAYFGGRARDRAGRKVLLATIYVLGIATSFSVLGVVAAMTGGLFGAALQQPVVILFIAGVLVALSLSSFGLYQLRPPAAMMRWAGSASGGAMGAAFMGLTMGIVAAPCVGPLVLALLLAVGTRQDPFLGFLLFFALAGGMGLPYLILAMAAGSINRLPRSGEWLLWVERLFGFVLLGMAAYFVAPLMPYPLGDWLLPGLIVVAGFYLGFVDRAGQSLRIFRPLKRAVGFVAIALAFWIAWPHRAESAIPWQELTATTVEKARYAGRPVVIEFGAEWCVPCVEMARTTFVDAEVVRAAARFEMAKADITQETEEHERLLEHFDVRGVPTVVVFDATGTEVARLVGYTSAEALLAAMERAG